MRTLIKEGYGAVYITEHDKVWSSEELSEVQEAFSEIRVFGGIERTIERCHLQILGTCDPAYAEISDPVEIITRAREEGLATVLAHPLRWMRGDEILACGVLPDALECGTPNHDDVRRKRAIKVCEQLDLAPVFADDAHCEEIIGSYWIETEEPLVEARDIRKVLIDRSYEVGSRRRKT